VNIAGEMQALMVTLDVKRAREVWKLVAPHLRQPESDEEMLTTLHLARTESPIVNTKLRYYSHCWLVERNLPSLLPDQMRPAAEREYPRKVQGSCSGSLCRWRRRQRRLDQAAHERSAA
jgi:hypothetical protein